MATTKDIIADFEAWQTKLFQTLVKATKAANAIPAGDVSFYKTLDRDFANNMKEASASTLDMCNGILRQAGGQSVEELKDGDDMKDRFDIIVDVVDNMLEKVDVVMDEMKAPRKKGGAAIAQSAPVVALAKSNKLEYKLIHAQNIARPQLRFPDPVDNSSTPFARKINYKPNAKVDLNYGMDLNSDTPSELIEQPHPYEYEIKHLEYPEHMFEQRPEQLYHPFDTTSAIWVETEEELKEMCKSLEVQREIAIDLEHHDYRSFQGFVCLMQISTRDQDYIIDTLELRGSLHLLNQSFTDPKIVKIFHGADHDIIWLQRDFGVYIVNLFDTYHASKLLEFGAHSLAHLLKLYADYDADKRYQLADWRIRPLPKEMLNYARSDTHFLLYVYDRMRNALLDKSNPVTHNLLHATLQRSAETSLKRHTKEIYDAEGGDGPGGWRNLYSKWNRALNGQQFAVFKAVHAWRDQMAREEDESIRYVLPNHMMFTLAEKMPEESAAVLACCNPVPPPVRMHATDLALLIAQTKSRVTSLVASQKIVEIQVPVHVRFDPKTGLQGTDEAKSSTDAHASSTTSALAAKAATSSSQSGKSLVASSSSMFQSTVGPIANRPVVDPTPFIAKRSGMFGDMSTSNASKEAQVAEERASRIMYELSIQRESAAAVFKEIDSVVQVQPEPEKEVVPAAEEEVVFVPQEERATKKRTDVLLLNTMSKKRSRALDEDRAELRQEEQETEGETGSGVSSAVEGGENDDVVAIKKKKSKKEKKEKTSASTSLSATPASSAPGTDNEEEGFQPFDYSTAQSVVDGTIDDAINKKKKKQRKQAPAPNAPPAPFDPYNKLEEKKELQKKDASFSRAPKSGSRSMSYARK
ncbi:exosome nuclease subunit [Linnemannia hyalina]|uniref:Exosome nuclease subunit n=1 Tax=Linnemannia hyalina TaxID=64524 RepID=A0A9P7XYU3_9FUNG|nr:exosome nuclease subunit [Linnemannia hyalina]